MSNDLGRKLFIASSVVRGHSLERAQIDWDNWEGDFMTQDEWQKTAEQLIASVAADDEDAGRGESAHSAHIKTNMMDGSIRCECGALLAAAEGDSL